MVWYQNFFRQQIWLKFAQHVTYLFISSYYCLLLSLLMSSKVKLLLDISHNLLLYYDYSNEGSRLSKSYDQ